MPVAVLSYKQISSALICTPMPAVYIPSVNSRKRARMNNHGGNVGPLHRWRFSVDVLIGAATISVAFAALSTLDKVPAGLAIACALIGLGLILERKIDNAQRVDAFGLQLFRLQVDRKSVRTPSMWQLRSSARRRERAHSF